MNELSELLDHYFSLGVAEGKEGRNHDTETGEAQATRHLIDMKIERLQRELALARSLRREELFPDMSSRIKAEREQARRQAFIEAAEIAENHSELRGIEWWLNATKKEVSADACRSIAAALRKAAEV